MRNVTRGLFLCAFAVPVVGGCAGVVGGGDPEPDPGLRNLSAIDFTNDVPRNSDPATAALDGGSVVFSGGTAGTLGILPLYFNDSFAWNLSGATAEVSFENLEVKAVRFYFAHRGSAGATLRALSAGGTVLGTAESFPASILGDAGAIFEIGAGDSSIARLEIETSNDATVALDHLVLSVPE